MDSDFIDVTPSPYILKSMANQNLPWWKALAELIDNSLEHRATRVIVKMSRQHGMKTVTVSDDGHGVPDISNAIKLGGHRKHEGGGGLSLYGVGLKDAWLSFGERLDIDTVRCGRRLKLSVSTSSIKVDGGRWRIPAPVEVPVEGMMGTEITLFLKGSKNYPGSECWDQLCWVFEPALTTGRQIIRQVDNKRSSLCPAKMPPLSDSISDSFDISGKPVKFCIGLLPDGMTNSGNPFWVRYDYRNIVKTGIGTGGYSDSRLGGWIALGEGWKLSKNKDDFSENQDDLSEAIFKRIEPLLKKADALSRDIECEQLKLEIERIINTAIQTQKTQKRQPPKENTGTILPVGTTRKIKRAAQVHVHKPGTVTGNCAYDKRRGMSLDFYSATEDELVGKYDHYGRKIRLNLGHPYVGQLKEQKNSLGLVAVIAAILSSFHCVDDADGRINVLSFPSKEIIPTFSSIARTLKVGAL